MSLALFDKFVFFRQPAFGLANKCSSFAHFHFFILGYYQYYGFANCNAYCSLICVTIWCVAAGTRNRHHKSTWTWIRDSDWILASRRSSN